MFLAVYIGPLRMFLDPIDPLTIVVFAGLLGGIASSVFLNKGKLDIPSIGKTPNGNKKKVLSRHVRLGFLEYGLYGIIAALITWGIGEANQVKPVLAATATISGISGVYFIARLNEAKADLNKLVTLLADKTDAMTDEARELESKSAE